MPLLQIDELTIAFLGEAGETPVVEGLDLTLDEGQVLGLVGESGCGKSVTARSIMRLLDTPPTTYPKGAIRFSGEDLLRLTEPALKGLRGNRMAMIFQEPMTSLNPTFTVGWQLDEVLRLHTDADREARHARTRELLAEVGIGAADRRLAQYPHELSGGLRQRMMIAMAIACKPRLLIADEPTTALDVTVQAQILDLLLDLRDSTGMAILLITHDLGVVAETCDEVAIMYAGRIVERATAVELFTRPHHPYTIGLLASIPRLESASGRLPTIAGTVPPPGSRPQGCAFAERCPRRLERCIDQLPPLAGDAVHEVALLEPDVVSPPLLEAEALKVHFPTKGGFIHAVEEVSLSLEPGETLGIVGESGCGKSTLARALLRLVEPTAGRVRLAGEDITALGASELRRRRRFMQLVFQDPFASLDPRCTIAATLEEPLLVHGFGRAEQRRARVAELLVQVGLDPAAGSRYPHEFSGGQRQRIAIARAIALKPKLVIADEPVSALDVSIQSQIINLLLDLRDELGLAVVFISHDLAVVRLVSRRIAVMYLGRIVEVATSEALFAEPQHPYTQTLLAAIPEPVPKGRRHRGLVTGEIPSPEQPPSGCAFHPRCPRAVAICRATVPPLEQVRESHTVRCFSPGEAAYRR